MSKFQVMDGIELGPVITGPHIADADLAIVEAVERELVVAHSEGRRLSRNAVLMRHVPDDDDYFVNQDRLNQRRRVEHWLRKRKATTQL